MREHSKDGVSERQLRQLRVARCEASLDLHGLTAAQAAEELARFIAAAQYNEKRVVEVIHGHGQGILRDMARQSLARNNAVLAFVEQRKNPGALIVRLKKR